MQASTGNKKIAKAAQDLIVFRVEEHCLRWGARPSKPLSATTCLVGSTPTSSAIITRKINS